MSRKRKAAPGVATIGSGKEEQIREQTINLPGNEYIMQPERVQGRIEALLLQGEANAINARQLAKLAGAAGARDLRLMVERERKNGALILSSVRGRGGYYLPACGDKGKAELRAFDRRITACIKSLVIMLHPVRKALKEMEDGEHGKEQGRTPDMV